MFVNNIKLPLHNCRITYSKQGSLLDIRGNSITNLPKTDQIVQAKLLLLFPLQQYVNFFSKIYIRINLRLFRNLNYFVTMLAPFRVSMASYFTSCNSILFYLQNTIIIQLLIIMMIIFNKLYQFFLWGCEICFFQSFTF